MSFRGARFWWDRVESDEKSAKGDPELITRALDGYFDDEAHSELRHVILNQNQSYSGMIIPPHYAFFMRGTTGELTRALFDARMSLQYFVLHEPLLIRYFRVSNRDLIKAEAFTETVIGIAGHSYWGEDFEYSPTEPRYTAPVRKGWKNLIWTYQNRTHTPIGPNTRYFIVVQFPWLIAKGLPACKRGEELGRAEWTPGYTKEFPDLPPLFPSLPPVPNNPGS